MSRLSTLFSIWRKSGTGSLLRYAADRLGKRLLSLQVVELVWLEASKIQLTEDANPGFTFRFLAPEEVAAHAQLPENQLDQEMVARAAAGSDLCFAVLQNGRLASYGWYALRGVEGRHNFGVSMSYPDSVAYMYKGFTHRDFRGLRLHGIGMKRALLQLNQRGIHALVSTVDWTNTASLRSCDRLGYQRLGQIIRTGKAPGTIWYIPRSAARKGVRCHSQINDRPVSKPAPVLHSPLLCHLPMACDTRASSK
ncbi:MAG: GNAT family N-acetyltransferase [Planctomycetaceae bacterium]|nr:GNAT family N-acetyltransferase [Planctomycetaceae bacterium]